MNLLKKINNQTPWVSFAIKSILVYAAILLLYALLLGFVESLIIIRNFFLNNFWTGFVIISFALVIDLIVSGVYFYRKNN